MFRHRCDIIGKSLQQRSTRHSANTCFVHFYNRHQKSNCKNIFNVYKLDGNGVLEYSDSDCILTTSRLDLLDLNTNITLKYIYLLKPVCNFTYRQL